MVAYLQGREIFIFDGMAGADPACTKKFRIINELASRDDDLIDDLEDEDFDEDGNDGFEDPL